MPKKNGHYAIIEQFLADGMNYMFGNPGTVEQGFLDALDAYPAMNYILTLQESIAVLCADGYARATQQPALVQIHSTPGLGNAIGNLYQAKRGHSPLVVIGGDAGIRYQAMDAQMAGDLVGMAEPVTKWATMVKHPSSLLRVLRRAVRVANTPPKGPVYVCLPQDILDAPVEEEVFPTSHPSTRTVPAGSFVQDAADMLAGADRPRIYFGDGVSQSGGEAELTQVAEMLGAPTYSVDAGDLTMSFSHPLFQGSTGHMFGEHSLPITQEGDVNLVVGTYMVPEVFPKLSNIFAPDAKTIHIDLNAYEIAKNHPVDLSVVADPKSTLAQLADALGETLGDEQRKRAAARTEELRREQHEQVAAEKKEDAERDGEVPMQFAQFAKALASALPDDAVIFDEALTSSPDLTRYLPPTKPGHFFQTRGGSLGVGFPGAIGLKLAHPEKTVVGVSGDGGSMYTIQSLWTAARHGVDVKFVVCNNSSYRLLQLNIEQFRKERGMESDGHPLPFDLSEPPIQFAGLAQAMGVQSLRVEKPWNVEDAVEQMLGHPGPFLVDVVLEGDVHPELIGVHCGQ